MRSEQELREAVADGVCLFDRKAPENWRGRTDLRTLNQEQADHCVGAQVFGSYGRTKELLGITSTNEEAIRFGLYTYDTREYPVLTRLWLEALDPARVAESPAPQLPLEARQDERELALV